MKRYLVLCLLLALVVPCLIVPASATGAYDEIISENVETISGDLYDWFVIWYDYFINKEYGFTLEDLDGDGTYTEVPRTNFEMDLISIYEFCTQWVWDFWDYFFAEDQTISSMRWSYNSSTGTITNYYTSYTGSGFDADLNQISNNISQAFYQAIKQMLTYLHESNGFLSSLVDNLASVYNYFCVADTTVTVETYGFNSSGEWTMSIAQKTYTSFIADLHNLFDRFYNLLYDLLSGGSSLSGPVEDEVNEDATEASEILDILDDVTKPDEAELEDLADISGYVDAGDVSTLAACLSPLFTSAVFLPCIMLSLIFMLVAYVLYGKR